MGEKEALKKRQYSELFKRKVIEEYLISGQSKMSLLKKYDIRMKVGSKDGFDSWDMKIFIKK